MRKKSKAEVKEELVDEGELVMAGHEEEEHQQLNSAKVQQERKSVFDKWSEKLKDFLDNAE
ncbi:hypothetical protein ACU8V7_17280 [Zobellia nedashkovskayae]